MSTALGWMDQTIACSISIHAWGNSKGVKAADVSQFSSELAHQAAKKRVSVTKRLLECREYQAIKSRDGFAGKWFQEHSVPSMLRNGVYAVPCTIMEQWDAYLESYAEERVALVQDFQSAYAGSRYDAQYELGELFRAEDYPEESNIAEKFYVEVRYLELDVPGKLQLIAPDAFKKAHADLMASVEQGKAHIESILCTEALELVQGLRNTLQGLDDGTLKKFYDSHITKIAEWADLFLAARNVTGFDGLADIAEQLKAIALHCDKDAIKKFAFVRADIKHELDGTLIALKGLMEAQGARKIVLD